MPKARPRGAAVAKLLAIVVILALLAAIAYFALARSGAFRIERIDAQGVEHLTASEMTALVSVSEGTSLLDVDIAGIRSRLLQDAWIQDVAISRVFPDTLQIVVTEREIEAVVEIQTGSDGSVSEWAIASDGMWLMSIPDRDSEAGQATSSQVYEDADAALRIVDVPYGVSPEIGAYNTDENVANAIAIVSGMTTELADRVVTVSASDLESTTLTLDNGVEIAFGTATDIRAKERICLELLEQHADSIAYINVRNVDRPTYRAL